MFPPGEPFATMYQRLLGVLHDERVAADNSTQFEDHAQDRKNVIERRALWTFPTPPSEGVL